MRHRQAAKAMCDQHNIRPGTLYGLFNPRDPLGTNRVAPITLLDAGELRVCLLPKGLPVQRPGVSDAGKDKNCCTQTRLLYKGVHSKTHLRLPIEKEVLMSDR